MLERVKDTLSGAVALRQYFLVLEEWDEALKAKIDDTRFAHIHNLASNSHLAALVMALGRMWDTDKDAASIPNIASSTDWDALAKSLSGDRWEKSRCEAIDEFHVLVGEHIDSDLHKAIFVSRTEGFAHEVEEARIRKKMLSPRRARYDELYEVTELSIRAVNLADLAINSSQTGYEFLQGDFDALHRLYFERIPDIRAELAGGS